MYHHIQSVPQNMGQKYTKTTTFTSVHSNNVANGIDETALHYQVRTFCKDPTLISRVWKLFQSYITLTSQKILK